MLGSSIAVFWEGQELVQRTSTELTFKDFGVNMVRCVCLSMCVFRFLSSCSCRQENLQRSSGLLAPSHINVTAMQVDPLHWKCQFWHDLK